MTLSECSPRQGSPLSCVMSVTGLGRTFNTAAARLNATPRPSSSLSSAFSARSDKASWDRKYNVSRRDFQTACTLFSFFLRRCHCCTDIWDFCVCRGTYCEDGVMVVQSGPSLTGVAGYGEHHNLCFITLLLLKDTVNKQPDTTTKNQNQYSLNL